MIALLSINVNGLTSSTKKKKDFLCQLQKKDNNMPYMRYTSTNFLKS